MSDSKAPAITPGAIVGIAAAVVLTVGTGMVGCPIYVAARNDERPDAQSATVSDAH